MERPGDIDYNGYNNDDPLRCSGGQQQLISVIPHKYNIVKNIKDTQPKITSDSPSVIAALNYYVALDAYDNAVNAVHYDASEVDRLRQAADQAWKKLGTWHIDAVRDTDSVYGDSVARKYYDTLAAVEERDRSKGETELNRLLRLAEQARRNLQTLHDPQIIAAADCHRPNGQMGGGIIDMLTDNKPVRRRSRSSKRKSLSSRRSRKTKSNRRGRSSRRVRR